MHNDSAHESDLHKFAVEVKSINIYMASDQYQNLQYCRALINPPTSNVHTDAKMATYQQQKGNIGLQYFCSV